MKRTVAWILPKLIPSSDRFRTVFRMVRALAQAGDECQIFFQGGTLAADLLKNAFEWYGLKGIKLHAGWTITARFEIAIFTTWRSAFFVHNTPLFQRRIYFLQEWEADATAMGGESILAENACQLGMPVITEGRWLAAKLHSAFHLQSRSIDFGVASDVTPPSNRPTAGLAICFWYVPTKPQYCPELGIEALKLLKEVLPSLQIYLLGTGNAPVLPLEAKWVDINSQDKAFHIFAHCQVGLTLHSTNLSRVPFEMLAAGLPVVDLHGPQTIYDLPSEAVRLAGPNARAVMTALLHLLSDSSLRADMSTAGRAFMNKRSPEAESRQFTQAFDASIATTTTAKKMGVPEPLYTGSAINAESIPDPNLIKRSWPLVTFDVWDTALRRNCHADEVKLHTARYLRLKHAELFGTSIPSPFELVKERVRCEHSIGLREKTAGNDDEYFIEDVFELWVNRISARVLSVRELKLIARELTAVELSQERRVIYPDPSFPDLLSRFSAAQTCFISDFYMSANSLRDLLVYSGLDSKLARGITSTDAKLNKRSGRLFELVQNHFKVAPADHLHIGDNAYSDFFLPQKRGMKSVHFIPRKEHALSERLNREYKIRQKETGYAPDVLTAMAQVRTASADGISDAEAMQALGRSLSPLLTNFALYLGEQAIQRGLTHLYFFTREGEFFAEIYSALARKNPLGIAFPKPVVLEVSRLATFSASLQRFDTNEFMRMWNLYSTQSFRAFFISLDMDPTPLLGLLQDYKIPFAEPLKYPWSDSRVLQLFADSRFQQALSAHVAIKRKLAREYLLSKGITGEEDQIGIVDIGWRGTIQDNVANILPGTHVHGWYFGMLPVLNEQPANVSKFSYGPGRPGDDEETRRLLDFVSPLEMLCNSRFGTTLRYVRENGVVLAQRETDEREEAAFAGFTQHFQKGVLSQVETIAEQIALRALSSEELRPLTLKSLGQLVHNPPVAAAKAYFSLNHNETFGVGVFDDKQRYQARLASIKALYERGDLEAYEQQLSVTTWPQAFTKLCGIAYPFFNSAASQSPEALTAAQRNSARELSSRALASFQRKDYAIARQFALQSLAVDPWSLRIHHLAYRACLALNQTKTAMFHFRLIGKLNVKHPPTLNEFACRSSAVGLDNNAARVFETILEAQPAYKPAVQNLARLHLRSGKFTEALALLDEHKDEFKNDHEHQLFTAVARTVASIGFFKESDGMISSAKADDTNVDLLRRLTELRAASITDPAKLELQSTMINAFTKPVSDHAYLS